MYLRMSLGSKQLHVCLIEDVHGIIIMVQLHKATPPTGKN